MTVPDDALQILAAYKQRQDAERAHAETVWQASALMSTDEVGGVVTPVAFNDYWTRMQEATGVRHVRLHDLRHLHVSFLVRESLDARTIAERSGIPTPHSRSAATRTCSRSSAPPAP